MDSEYYLIGIDRSFIAQYQLNVDIKEFYQMIGAGNMDMFRDIYRKCQTTWSFEEFMAHYREFHHPKRDAMPFKDLAFPDVKRNILRFYREGYQLACASSSKAAYIHKALKDIGIFDYFSLVVTGHDFTHSKPDPEIYNYCLKTLAAVPNETVVVEDSPAGIKAAKSAGLYVYGRKDRHFGLDQSGADILIADFDELYDQLKEK